MMHLMFLCQTFMHTWSDIRKPRLLVKYIGIKTISGEARSCPPKQGIPVKMENISLQRKASGCSCRCWGKSWRRWNNGKCKRREMFGKKEKLLCQKGVYLLLITFWES